MCLFEEHKRDSTELDDLDTGLLTHGSNLGRSYASSIAMCLLVVGKVSIGGCLLGSLALLEVEEGTSTNEKKSTDDSADGNTSFGALRDRRAFSAVLQTNDVTGGGKSLHQRDRS